MVQPKFELIKKGPNSQSSGLRLASLHAMHVDCKMRCKIGGLQLQARRRPVAMAARPINTLGCVESPRNRRRSWGREARGKRKFETARAGEETRHARGQSKVKSHLDNGEGTHR